MGGAVEAANQAHGTIRYRRPLRRPTSMDATGTRHDTCGHLDTSETMRQEYPALYSNSEPVIGMITWEEGA